jgi:hypothetical protein
MTNSTVKLDRVITNFHTNIICFIDELIELFPSDVELILIRVLLKDNISPVTIIDMFVKEISCNRESIKKRDDNFFLNSKLFETFDKSKKHLEQMWKSHALDESDRQVVWQWFDTFIILADQYQALKEN